MTLKDNILTVLQAALHKLEPVPDPPPLRMEYAREEQFGDYACTVAMDKRWRELYAAKSPAFKNPKKFAEAILETIQNNPDWSACFQKLEIAGPGFLNLTVSDNLLYKQSAIALGNADNYGRSVKDKPRKIIFEFVSANPTGPLNVVSARAAALGDSCCNLLAAAGDEVFREFYVNDSGNQVDLLGESCLLRYLESRGVPLKFAQKTGDTIEYPAGPGLHFPQGGYHGEYVTATAIQVVEQYPALAPDEALLKRAQDLASSATNSQNPIEALRLVTQAADFGQRAVEYLQGTHRRDLERFRVHFDNFFSERSLHEKNLIPATLVALEGHTYKDETGCVYFQSTTFHDDKDRPVIRSDGRPTYFMADIAYHRSKIERGFQEIHNVLGPDHHGYIKRLAGALEAMGFDQKNFRAHVAQQVNLLENGQPMQMSKRAGKFVTLETLLDEIPTDVSRYFFVMRSFDSHLDFDFAEARDTSEQNPYYYVAYAHARICSIVRKAQERKLSASDPAGWTPELLAKIELTPERRRLLRQTARFPDEIRESAANLEPHRLVNYLYRLATALSQFYGPKENRIIDLDAETAGVLLGVLAGVRICLKNGLTLLGMEAPEYLSRE